MTDRNDVTALLFHDNYLIEDLTVMLEQINAQIEVVERSAADMGVPPLELQTATGDWVMRSLFSAKAHTINAIVTLRSIDNYAKTINIYNGRGEITE